MQSKAAFKTNIGTFVINFIVNSHGLTGIHKISQQTIIIVVYMICKCFVSRLIESVLFLINVSIFDDLDPRLSGLFRPVPTSPDNRGLTALSLTCFIPIYCAFQ